MAGLKPLPVYHYDTEENNYKYLGKFASRAEVFKMYSDSKKGVLFQDGYNYKRLSDGTFVTKEKVGRESLRRLIRITEDPTIYKRNDDKPIEIYNYLDELVGTVSNIRVLDAILNTPYGTARTMLVKNGGKNCHFGNLKFKYKESEDLP